MFSDENHDRESSFAETKAIGSDVGKLVRGGKEREERMSVGCGNSPQ